jgi:predicted benzoate:H+ symporter BenE
MIVTYLVLARLQVRGPVVGAFALGLVIVIATGDLGDSAAQLELAAPVLTWPRFELDAILAIGLPLWVLTMTAQNATGVAVLQANGYEPPTDAILVSVGTASAVLAPLGSHALNLAALSAAFVAGPEGGADRDERWRAAVAAGLAYLLVAVFAGGAAALFAAMPAEFVAALAGLGLLGIIGTSLPPRSTPRRASPRCWRCSWRASGVTLLGVGAAFWGLVVGVVAAAGAGSAAARRADRRVAERLQQCGGERLGSDDHRVVATVEIDHAVADRLGEGVERQAGSGPADDRDARDAATAPVRRVASSKLRSGCSVTLPATQPRRRGR